jgi:hypothetical protein
MAARDGDLLVLAVQRGGEEVGEGPQTLAVGDHLLLQGTWQALDKHLADPQVLVVDSPDVVRRQAVPLGLGAKEAIAVLALLVILLATGWVPSAVAGLACAVLLVLLGVVTVPQAYKGIDWNTCFLVGGMIPLGAAMTQTGAADLIGHTLIGVLGDAGPRALLAGLFLAALAITSVISNTSTALPFFPIGIATAHEVGVSPLPFIIGIAIASHAALLTPVATPVNLMVMGPGGCRRGLEPPPELRAEPLTGGQEARPVHAVPFPVQQYPGLRPARHRLHQADAEPVDRCRDHPGRRHPQRAARVHPGGQGGKSARLDPQHALCGGSHHSRRRGPHDPGG